MAIQNYNNSQVARTSSVLYKPNNSYPTTYVGATEPSDVTYQKANGDVFTFQQSSGNDVLCYSYYYGDINYTYFVFFSTSNFSLTVYKNGTIYTTYDAYRGTLKNGTRVYHYTAADNGEGILFSIASSFDLDDIENVVGNEVDFDSIYLILNSEAQPLDSDPFAPGGTSEPGGGNGTFNGTSDSNPIPGDPAISATDTGFMTVFATNTAGLRALANSLWTDIFSAIQPGGSLEGTVEALKNIVASPYDAILGCHIVPVNVPTGTSRNVKMYGVLPSSVSLPVASSQWVHKDCGSLTIQPYDGSYLDYAPYSKVTSLYLPFVGVVSVDIDIIMNMTIGVYYKIDIISGQCIVYVTKNNDVYFQYQGQCAVPIPVTSIDWSNTVSSGLGLIGSVTNIVGSAVGGALAGGPAGALSGAVTGTIGQAGSMAQNVMNSKPDIKAGSGVGGAAALLGCKAPYLIIERPRKSTPKNQNHYTGYPSNICVKLGDLEGYTEVSRVYVNHMNATTEEKAEIERLLNEGVIL